MAAETTNQEEPDREYGYTIDGEIYPEPENLTVDDHRIIKRYTGLNFRDLAARANDEMYVDQDGVAAILHISYRHRHPDLSFDEIAAVIGRQDFEAVQATLQPSDGAVPLDPGSTNPLDGSSERSSSEKNKDSGTSSSESSDLSDENPATTGTSELDTSSPESDPETVEALAS